MSPALVNDRLYRLAHWDTLGGAGVIDNTRLVHAGAHPPGDEETALQQTPPGGAEGGARAGQLLDDTGLSVSYQEVPGVVFGCESGELVGVLEDGGEMSVGDLPTGWVPQTGDNVVLFHVYLHQGVTEVLMRQFLQLHIQPPDTLVPLSELVEVVGPAIRVRGEVQVVDPEVVGPEEVGVVDEIMEEGGEGGEVD